MGGEVPNGLPPKVFGVKGRFPLFPDPMGGLSPWGVPNFVKSLKGRSLQNLPLFFSARGCAFEVIQKLGGGLGA